MSLSVRRRAGWSLIMQSLAVLLVPHFKFMFAQRGSKWYYFIYPYLHHRSAL